MNQLRIAHRTSLLSRRSVGLHSWNAIPYRIVTTLCTATAPLQLFYDVS